MAGMRKSCAGYTACLLLVFLCNMELVQCLTCVSNKGQPVDWFIGYKLPGSEPLVPKNSFFYMDSELAVWTLAQAPLSDDNNQAISNTLNQIYKTAFQNVSNSADELLYLMYNDEKPEPSEQLNFYVSQHGHTKGVIGFDSRSGFWLIHSTPKFPPKLSDGYKWPNTADIYGQSFLCITMATEKNVDEIGQQLWYNYPQIYDYNMPKSFEKYSNMVDAVNGKHIAEAPWTRQTWLTSMGGVKFLSFAKSANFANDLYSDLVAPRLSSPLLVESWQNGRNKMCSNCTGKYKVFNIESLNFKDSHVMFKETQDHSKWAVTNSSSSVWTCVGDINRQMSQIYRPGGTVCFQNENVWNNFHKIIFSIHACGTYKECVPPLV